MRNIDYLLIYISGVVSKQASEVPETRKAATEGSSGHPFSPPHLQWGYDEEHVPGPRL